MMPADGLDQLARSDSVLLGAVGWPGVPDHVSLWGLLIPIRRGFDQYANVRPCKLLPGVRTPLANRTEADIDFFAGQFTASGFTGGLNWYRNLDRNWELTSTWHDAQVTPPALFIAGERDGVIAGPGARKAIDRMPASVPGLRGTVLLPGCGHWTQQERPAEVNEALISFADGAR